MTIYTRNTIYLSEETFYNNKNIQNVNCSKTPWENNSMHNAFYSCYNLLSVTDINDNVTDMSNTFSGCSKLVNAPVIPNSVTNMDGTFNYCTKLVNAPNLGNSVINMSDTFYGCTNLAKAPNIPATVTNMDGSFQGCKVIVTAPNIPASVTSMEGTFQNCASLRGSIYIRSENVQRAYNCFYNSTLPKFVYIPYFYANGDRTMTYNAFIEAGYDDMGTTNAVWLQNIDRP